MCGDIVADFYKEAAKTPNIIGPVHNLEPMIVFTYVNLTDEPTQYALCLISAKYHHDEAGCGTVGDLEGKCDLGGGLEAWYAHAHRVIPTTNQQNKDYRSLLVP
jgi:hypothetical protein